MREGAPVVGYVRVSTEEQAESGLSLSAQVEQLETFAAARGLNLIDVVPDAAKSAGSLKRPGIRRVLQMLDSGEAVGVLVSKFDRMTRRVRDAALLLEEYFPPGRDCWLIGAAEAIDTKTVSGRMVCYMLAVVSQYEREATTARTETVRAHKRSRGQQLGNLPFGQQLGDDGETLVPCPADLLAWAKVWALKEGGLSTRAIAAELDRLGVPRKRSSTNKDGSARKRDLGRWAHQSVAEILRLGPPPAPPQT